MHPRVYIHSHLITLSPPCRWTGKKASSLPSGHKIDFVTVGSRTSAFVPVLQRLTVKAAVSDTNDVISIDGETDQEEGSSKASAKDAKAKAKPQGRTKAAVEAKGTATGKGTGRGRGKKVDEEEVDIAKEEGREGEEAPLEDERAGVRKVAAKKAPAAEPSGRKRKTAGAGAAAEADDGVASDAAAGTEVVADSKGHDGPTGDGPDGGGDVLRVDDAPPPAAKKAKASKPAGSKSSARNKGAAAAAAALEADTAIKAEGAVKGTARGRGPAAAVTAQGTEGMEVAAVAGVPALQAAAGRKAAIGRGKKKY